MPGISVRKGARTNSSSGSFPVVLVPDPLAPWPIDLNSLSFPRYLSPDPWPGVRNSLQICELTLNMALKIHPTFTHCISSCHRRIREVHNRMAGTFIAI